MTVLIVDDQEKILEATKKLVDWERLQIQVVYTASSAVAAKEILSRYSVDIMLTDIEMPEEDGISLQKWQAENFPMVYCIFLTSHADFAYAKEAIRGGAFDYILQPASIPEIEEAMERCIEHLKQRTDYMQKSSRYDELTQKVEYPQERKPDSARWAKWLIRGDDILVRNQIANLLRLADQDGYLTISYRQQMIHAFLEACSVACYEKKLEFSELFEENFSYETMLHSYHSDEELNGAIDRLLYSYKKEKAGTEGREDASATVQERIREVMRYLEENMDRMVSRREAAKYVFLNEDYFSRMFRKESGMGFKEYQLKVKMDYAGKLLANTTMPVTLIASKVGYENFTNFSQMFRKVMGAAPTEYRKTHNKS
ncbi:response regulator [Blautia schinkii]|nr:response regulator [Blautia schinkii]